MFTNHPAAAALKSMGAFQRNAPIKAPKPTEPVLDSAAVAAKRAEAVLDAADQFTETQMRVDVAAAVQEWAETEAGDLGDGEGMADRLIALMVGLADENKDGDISEDEEVLISGAMETAADYMIAKGVAEDDVLALLNDGDADAANRVAEFLKGALPEGEEASMEDVDAFAFDADSSSSLFDSVLDAVYKKKLVVRGGRKVRIMKRVSGRVVLSAGQKVAIRKARRKAHSATARMHRAKSMKVRTRAGL